MNTPHIDLVVILVMATFTIFACVWDYKTRKLPNWLTVPVFAVGLVYHLVKGLVVNEVSVWDTLGFSLLGFATGFGLLFILMVIGGGGGGDVKFMAALGTWVGAYATIIIFVGSAVVAVFGMMGVFVWRMLARSNEPVAATAGGSDSDSDQFESPQQQVDSARQTIPYAVAICVSAWVFFALKTLVIFNSTY